MRNRTSDLRIPRFDALPLSEVYYEVHTTRFLHTARISNVDSVMFVNRMREMVSFESKGLRFDYSWGRIVFFFFPTLETRRKIIFLLLFTELKLTISLILFTNIGK